MTDEEREMDLTIAELEQENRLMRARNERLERELTVERNERERMQDALERILAVSNVALWDGKPQGTGEVGTPKRNQETND
jgi:hypothetical protein